MGSKKGKPTSVRFGADVEDMIAQYMRIKSIKKKTTAISHLTRAGGIWFRHQLTGGGKPVSNWYTPEEESEMRCWIDEMSNEERDKLLFELTTKYVSPEQMRFLAQQVRKEMAQGFGSYR